MRNIKFRGKDILNNIWVYGYFWIAADGTHYIKRFNNSADCEVFPESVGQYTGVPDKTGKEIYDGYIVIKHIKDNKRTEIIEVKWNEYQCGFNISKGKNHWYEVIGNIYENPDIRKIKAWEKDKNG